MINIPTELLRTLVEVVDHKSFTKAAHALGITQPAVSAQIKRLQTLLDAEVFDKNEAGVVPTAVGDAVVTYARRLLSLNDQILQVAAPAPVARRLRIGMNSEYFSPYLGRALVNFRKRWPHRKFHVTVGTGTHLLHYLRTGELDLVASLSMDKPARDARHHWMEEMVWAGSASMSEQIGDFVPLISRGEKWMNHCVAIDALEKARRAYEITLIAPSIATLISAAHSGLGILSLARRRIAAADLTICADRTLPKLPDLVSSIYVSETGETDILNALADEIAAAWSQSADPASMLRIPFRELVDSND